MACYEFIEEDEQEKALPGTPEYYKQWEQEDIARDIAQQRKQQQKAWYDEPESAGSEHNVDWLGY
jgi:ribosomal protein S4